MARNHRAQPAGNSVERGEQAPQAARASFSWSNAKIRLAGIVLLGAALPAAVAFAAPAATVKWLCLAWLIGVALLMRRLGRCAKAEAEVLAVDEHGILDHRVMARPIAWREIAGICPVDIDRAQVVDIRLRWPEETLAGTRWPTRVGAYCQKGYGVPAVTISMLLLDGDVGEVLAAVAQYRPDLLHGTNRGV